jgi:aspartate 4-decarboxylase
LSPFELKDYLTELASSHAERMMLNAGRGNPNFLATMPRKAFLQLGLFAVEESERSFSYMPRGVGGLPCESGMEARFDSFLAIDRHAAGIGFLATATSYVRDELGLSASAFLHEMVTGILGCEYPTPPRILPITESIEPQYLVREVIGGQLSACGLDLFATEGGTAAITYVFDTMRVNRLLAAGDRSPSACRSSRPTSRSPS